MATQLAERAADPVTIFRQTIAQPAFKEQLRMALPNHIPLDRFERVATTAVQQNPDLLNPQKVERRSLFGALVRAAQDGLLPDGREGAIVPFRGKAQWMPMVAGIMRKVRNSGEIASWEASAVFEKDTFERLLGDDQRIYHKPFEDGDPGQVVGAYSIVTFRDGTKSRDYLPRWRIERAREQNPIGKNSLMWTKFYDEGAVKTVIRHHAKRLPMSTDVEAIFERDETMTTPRSLAVVSEVAEPEPPRSRLDMIESQIAGDDDIPVREPEPPVEQEVITEQAEELEAEIIHELPPELEPTPDPANAKADEILAEIEGAGAIIDVNSIVSRNQEHIAALPDELQVKIEIAADKRKNAIRKQRESVKAEEPVK